VAAEIQQVVDFLVKSSGLEACKSPAALERAIAVVLQSKAKIVAETAFLLGLVMEAELASQIPQVLAGMVEIHDLHGAGEVLIRNIPYPFGAISHHHFLFRTAPAPLPGFHIDALAELFGDLNGARVGGRIRIAERVAVLVPLVWVNTQPNLASRVWAG